MTRVPDSELVLVPGGSLITAGATLPRSTGPVGGAGRLDGAARLHRDGGGLDRDPPPHPGRRRRHHAPPARPRDAAGRERPGDGGQGGYLLRSWNECG